MLWIRKKQRQKLHTGEAGQIKKGLKKKKKSGKRGAFRRRVRRGVVVRLGHPLNVQRVFLDGRGDAM